MVEFRIREDMDPMALLKAVKACRSEVQFTTDENGCLNLKSTLSQFVFTVAYEEPSVQKSGRIRCGEEDYEILREFLCGD